MINHCAIQVLGALVQLERHVDVLCAVGLAHVVDAFATLRCPLSSELWLQVEVWPSHERRNEGRDILAAAG